MKDQKVMFRLIPKEIFQVEANALGNKKGPSREIYLVYQYGNGMTAHFTLLMCKYILNIY